MRYLGISIGLDGETPMIQWLTNDGHWIAYKFFNVFFALESSQDDGEDEVRLPEGSLNSIRCHDVMSLMMRSVTVWLVLN